MIKEYAGILPFHEAFYIRSIGLAALRGVEGFDRFRHGIGSRTDSVRLIYELQTALTHAAAVSRFFWPASRDALSTARAARLRFGYDVGDNDPLANRDLRNAIEHFDERLDQFLATNPMGPIVDMVFGDNRLANEQLGHVLRLVDPDANIFVLLGQKFRFDEVELSLRTINDLSITMASKGDRLLHRGQ